MFYSHVNFSVTKICEESGCAVKWFYSHVNFSVTKIGVEVDDSGKSFTVT